MGFMTIAARHTSLIHPTLEEGTVYVYLLENLPVREVKWFVQQRHHVGIEERPAEFILTGNHGPAGMAAPARLRLYRGLHPDFAAACNSRFRIHDP